MTMPPSAAAGASWWQKLYQSGSSIRRLVITGAKYDALPLVSSLREGFAGAGIDADDSMIHSALWRTRPATAIVSTLASERPLRPYVFRSYQLPTGVKSMYPGQCKHTWLYHCRCLQAPWLRKKLLQKLLQELPFEARPRPWLPGLR